MLRKSAAFLMGGTLLASGWGLITSAQILAADPKVLQPPELIVPVASPPVPQLAPGEPVLPPAASKSSKVTPPAPKPAPAPAPQVETLPAPKREFVPVKPAAPAKKPSVPAEKSTPVPAIGAVKNAEPAAGSWKILIRPEVYKTNDPWEYVRTGGINFSNPNSVPPASAPQTTSAAAPGSMGPAMSGPVTPPAAASGAPCAPSGYQAAYHTVPFNRAEYEANPSYRHDAAMELLFGTLRPTTIVKQNQPYFSRYPDMFRYRHTVYPYLTPGSNTTDVNYYWNYNGYW